MTFLIKGETETWEVVIGLEVHAQVVSDAKLFSGAPTDFGANPNSQVSFVDAGMPGMLPVINEICVEQAVRTGLGLKAQINNRSVFSRKNYFYADLPQGYQISQFDLPIVGEGTIILDMPDGVSREIGIERLHLEQDAGKSIHDLHPSKTFIDLNRSGVALMEIVSKPDMRSPDEAGAYLRKLRSILRYLGTCDGNMDEGSMRCDANVSVRPVGETELRTRCEVKNVNSVRFVMQAIEHEARRHVDVYESGGEISQETRQYDPNKGETRSMRSKEMAHDYRYTAGLAPEFTDPAPDDAASIWIGSDPNGARAFDGTVTIAVYDNQATFDPCSVHPDGTANGETVRDPACDNASIEVRWENPTKNTDGTPLTDLAETEVYFGTAAGVYESSVTLPADQTATRVDGLKIGSTYFVSAKAVNSQGIRSEWSNEVELTAAEAAVALGYKRAGPLRSFARRVTQWAILRPLWRRTVYRTG